ncbi:MAG: hypothetical protein VB079_02000 [Petrimonas sp.]|uniref:hypothetical protein n=1 Tax=Petrimonas sp. TaxID=2023866 RepID=UPI002B3CFA16|nr:hypothetical protein [Petrimonas sp.]
MKSVDYILNIFKQYGIYKGLIRILYAILRPIFKKKENIVLAIQNHQPKDFDSRVRELTSDSVQSLFDSNIINLQKKESIQSILKNHSKGYYILENELLVASAFVQMSGKYKCGTYYYNIPSFTCVLKNLYVEAPFRGKSYGKYLNKARINNIPIEYLPVAFVIPDNRYALRNLKIFGFEEILYVKHITWFSKWTKMKLKILKAGKLADHLVTGFYN